MQFENDNDDINDNENNFSDFIERHDMLIVGNTMQFIENGYASASSSLKHYKFDTIGKKFSLIHEN